MSELQRKINHLNQLKRTMAEIQRRIESMQKEIDLEEYRQMSESYAAISSK